MRKVLFLSATVIVATFIAYSNPSTAKPAPGMLPKETKMTQQNSDAIRGRTLRWTFTDGPMAGVPVEHTFNEDGSVVWRLVGGAMNGASAREKECAAVKITQDVYAISYLAASGHTLTVVLNFKDKRMIGFGSNEKSWTAMTGSFEVVK
jgi:hypothetical protein